MTTPPDALDLEELERIGNEPEGWRVGVEAAQLRALVRIARAAQRVAGGKANRSLARRAADEILDGDTTGAVKEQMDIFNADWSEFESALRAAGLLKEDEHE